MNATRERIPFTKPSFPKFEYVKRYRRVLHAMEAMGLDAVLVASQSHLQYLTGYSGVYFAPCPFILSPGRAPTFIVRAFDEEAARACSHIDEIIPFLHQHDALEICADVLRRNALHDKRVGLELGRWSLAPNDVAVLQAKLPELKIFDATALVTRVAAVKSELEVEALRAAAATTDLAIAAFHGSIREDVTEVEVAAAIRSAVAAAGGELSWSINLLFGDRLRLPHGMPARNPLGMNEAAFTELSGTKHAYHSPLCRSAVLGRHPGLESLHAIAEEALEAALDAIKPGTTAGAVNAAARKVLERHGRSEALRARTGYQIGIHWVERGDLSLEPEVEDILETGMSFHIPLILFDEVGRQIGCSDSFVLTEKGAEILSKTPRALFRA
ncbi:M24 family metallopeptidase [Mesorhizobium sp. ORM16]|uniref:M24 family metallopeptidase n=1 Tax=Mesorhizobium sp. ORM16 TaxID=3376989 RepID=UPI0038578619